MTLQEILKAKGMSDADIESTMGEMKQNKIFTAGEENLDIRYSKLKADHDNLTKQHGEATTLIDQLKAGTKDSEALQGKITSYEQQITQLQEQLKQTQLDAEIKVALLAAKATDVDYMTFRLKEKGELELDKDGHIKGIDDRLAGLKTQYPTFFESGTTQRELQPQKLPAPDNGDKGMTKAEFLKKPYAERATFAQNNPDAYNTIMNR